MLTKDAIKEVATCLSICKAVIGKLPFMQVERVMQHLAKCLLILERELQEPIKKESTSKNGPI